MVFAAGARACAHQIVLPVRLRVLEVMHRVVGRVVVDVDALVPTHRDDVAADDTPNGSDPPSAFYFQTFIIKKWLLL